MSDTEQPVREANKKIMLALIENLASGRVDNAISLLADDVQWWFPGPAGHEPLAKEDLRGLYSQILQGFPQGLTPKIRSVTAEDDRVVVESRLTGTRQDGGEYDNEYCLVGIVRDGLVQTVREHLNLLRAGAGDQTATSAGTQ